MSYAGGGAVSYKRGAPVRIAYIHALRGYLALKKQPLPEDHHRTLGIALLQGPRRVQFLMSKVPMYRVTSLMKTPASP